MNYERAYYRWLILDYVANPQDGTNHIDYSLMLAQMYRKAYYFVVPNDENRAEDGLFLRDEYLASTEGFNNVVPYGPCSFLEFLIGVAKRLSEMLAEGEAIPVHEYFWELVRRLGMMEYTDDTYADSATTFLVDEAMTDFMDRKYARCGGGLFPLKNSKRDHPKEELWYQLNKYLNENPNFF